MFKFKLIISAAFVMLAGLFAKGQGHDNALKIDTGYKQSLAEIIAAGSHIESLGPDSLTQVIIKLKNLYTKNNSKPALVYYEFYAAKLAWLSSDHFKAMGFAVKSLGDAQKYGVNKPLAGIYALMGNLHKENSNYPMAFEAADKGLAAANESQDTAQIIALLGLKAMFIKTNSLRNSKPMAKDGSLELQFKGLELAEANPKYERLRIRFYDNIAQTYKDLKNYDKAIYYAKKGVALATRLNERRSLTYGYCWLGEASFYQGNRAYGLECLNKALKITIDIKQPYRTMELYETLAGCYTSAGDYKLAYQNLERSYTMRDSLKVRDNEKQISELQIKYETDRKDSKIAVMNQTNAAKGRQMLWLIGGSVLFIVTSLTLFAMYQLIYKNNLSLKAKNIQISEQSQKLQVLMQELHHRVKNNLQVVSSLLSLQSNRMTDVDARNALNVSRQRIEAMSILHHSLYQHDSANMVNMKEYISNLINSIMHSFGIKHDEIDIRLDVLIKDIDVDIALPLGLILNEWITNVFKHAYQNITARPKLELIVFYINDDDDIKVKIQDNGVGMPAGLWDNPKASFGIKLMKVLIKQIRGVCHVTSVNGTVIELDIACF